LYSLEFQRTAVGAFYETGEGFCDGGFSQARQIVKENMTPCEHSRHEQLQNVPFPDYDFGRTIDQEPRDRGSVRLFRVTVTYL
jgi:hypothetical protein